MKKHIPGFLVKLLLFTIISYMIQFLLTQVVFETDLFYSNWSIFVFLFLTTLVIYLIVAWVYENFEDKTGFAFMGLSLLKMFAAVVFLLPLLLSDIASALDSIFAFFIPYFLFLLFETLVSVKLLKA